MRNAPRTETLSAPFPTPAGTRLFSRTLEQVVFLLFLFNPLIRLSAGYLELFGDACQFLLLFLLLLSFFETRNERNIWFLLILTLLLVMKSLTGPNFMSEDIKFATLMLGCLFFLTEPERFSSMEALVAQLRVPLQISLFLCTAFLVVQTRNPASWYMMYDQPNFKANLFHPHSLAYLLLSLFVLNNLLNRGNKILLYGLHAVFLWLNLLTGVRTVLMALLVMLALEIIRNRDWGVAIVGTAGVVAYMVVTGMDLSQLAIFKKNVQAVQYSDISSGRFDLWLADMEYFVRAPIHTKLLGGGSLLTRKIHIAAVNQDIWSHNDFFQILLSYGIVGIGLYVGTLARFFAAFRVPLPTIGIVLFIAFINGFYPYAEFFYALPLLVIISRPEEKRGVA